MKKVLIIDDEFGPRESMRFLLKDEYEVECTESVDEGILALKENPPDIIISDIKMPGKTGIEGLKEIRDIDTDVSVIMLTGFGSLETAQQAIRLGANDYVKKPFDTTEMRNVVAKYIARTCAIRNKNAAAKNLKTLKHEMQETIRQKEKLATLGQASSEFVHDISNPLTVLSGYVELMINEMNTSADFNNNNSNDVMDCVENIQQSAERCKELLDSWRNFGYKSDRHNDLIDINSLINEVATAATPAIKAISGIIEIDAMPEDISTKGNSTQIFRALQNLVSNAVQALPQQNGKIQIKCLTDTNNIYIHVIDNGSGIHEDKLENIFKPYFTTKKLSGGTGLGLYITHKIAKEHSGDITLENHPAGGIIAKLILPIAQNEAVIEDISQLAETEKAVHKNSFLKNNTFRSATKTINNMSLAC